MSDIHIILTAEEAEVVRGPTAPGAALEPVPLADGETYVLPVSVLADPAHAARWGELRQSPARPLTPLERGEGAVHDATHDAAYPPASE